MALNKRLRQEIAHEAAKIIAHGGHEDYLMAKRKAASQLGVHDNHILPSNTEIETALMEYQTLFQQEQPASLNKMRRTALDAMQFFNAFEPVLTGSVLTGTAGPHSEIILHLFDDTPEAVGLFLDNKHIPASVCERRLQFQKNNPEYFTAYKFLAGEFEIVAIVLPLSCKKPPLDPINGKPMRRARAPQLKQLIELHTDKPSVSG